MRALRGPTASAEGDPRPGHINKFRGDPGFPEPVERQEKNSSGQGGDPVLPAPDAGEEAHAARGQSEIDQGIAISPPGMPSSARFSR